MIWLRTLALAGLVLLAATAPALPESVRDGFQPAPAAIDDIFVYHVKDGENLPGIAKKWFIDPENWRALQALNRIADPLQVADGTALQVRRSWLRVQLIEARVIAFRGAVTLVRDGKAVAAQIGTIVREDDMVRTGRNSFATLALPDGSTVSLPSASHVRMERLRVAAMSEEVDRRLALGAGEVDAQVTPMRNPRSSFLVQTPVAVAAVRGTRFRVSYVPADRRATVAVTRGKVEVTRSGTADRVLLNVGFGAAATAPHLSPAIALLQAPAIAGSNIGQTDRLVSVRLPEVAGAQRYVAEIATDAAFLNRIARVESDQPILRFADIPAGRLHLRAAAIDGYGLIGEMAELAFDRQLSTAAALPPAPLAGVVLLDDLVLSGSLDRSGWWTPAGAGSSGGAAAAGLAAAAVAQLRLADPPDDAADDSAPGVDVAAVSAGDGLSGEAFAARQLFAASGFGGGSGGRYAGGGGAVGPAGGAGNGGGAADGGGSADGDTATDAGQPDGSWPDGESPGDFCGVFGCVDGGSVPGGGPLPPGGEPLRPADGAPIPEPAAWLLMIGGFGMIGWRVRARRRWRRRNA